MNKLCVQITFSRCSFTSIIWGVKMFTQISPESWKCCSFLKKCWFYSCGSKIVFSYDISNRILLILWQNVWLWYFRENMVWRYPIGLFIMNREVSLKITMKNTALHLKPCDTKLIQCKSVDCRVIFASDSCLWRYGLWWSFNPCYLLALCSFKICNYHFNQV